MSYRDVIYIYTYIYVYIYIHICMTVCRADCGYTYLVHPCKMESRVGVQCCLVFSVV